MPSLVSSTVTRAPVPPHRYNTLKGQIPELARTGFTAIWLPPPADSVSPQVCHQSCCARLRHKKSAHWIAASWAGLPPRHGCEGVRGADTDAPSGSSLNRSLLPRVQGYLPRDLYKLDSAYGSEDALRQLISTMHDNGIKAVRVGSCLRGGGATVAPDDLDATRPTPKEHRKSV